MTTDVRANALSVKMTGPRDRRSRPRSQVSDRRDQHGQHARSMSLPKIPSIRAVTYGGRTEPTRPPDREIAPGQTERFAVTFIVTQPGRQIHRLDVTADGGHATGAGLGHGNRANRRGAAAFRPRFGARKSASRRNSSVQRGNDKRGGHGDHECRLDRQLGVLVWNSARHRAGTRMISPNDDSLEDRPSCGWRNGDQKAELRLPSTGRPSRGPPGDGNIERSRPG